jgi:dTDP-4-dehydrorhamnose reductase
MRVLVLGSSGQVGRELVRVLPEHGMEARGLARPQFDLRKPHEFEEMFSEQVGAVVNCAAWTAVDAAEDVESDAFIDNAVAPGRLARLCATRNIPFLHLSTDYVFDGKKGEPYREEDEPNPLSAYGRTKLAGEWAVLSAPGPVIVLRTSWVYAAEGRNFLLTMVRLAGERSELSVVADQRGAPTAAQDLAHAIASVLDRIRLTGWRDHYRGIYHAASTGETTWHGFAEAIFAHMRARGLPSPFVHPITTGEYPTRAIRPADSRLNCGKLTAVFGFILPPWEEGLLRVMQEVSVSTG